MGFRIEGFGFEALFLVWSSYNVRPRFGSNEQSGYLVLLYTPFSPFSTAYPLSRFRL